MTCISGPPLKIHALTSYNMVWKKNRINEFQSGMVMLSITKFSCLPLYKARF